MPEQPPVDEQQEIRQRAVRRLIAASVIVALAVVALTVLTKYEPEKPVTRTPSQETVLPPEKPVPAPQPETPPPPPLEEAQPETPPPPPPEVSSVPTVTPEKQPKPTEETPAKPAPAPAKPPVQATPKSAVEARSGLRLDHKLAEQPRLAKPAQPPAQARIAGAPPRAPAPLVPAEVAALKGYTVQLGVFSNPTNALQLQEKLAQHGIKSYTETKLNVGPFKTKAEADQALAKLRSLGISAVVVPGR